MADADQDRPPAKVFWDDPQSELSSNRTALSFERTMMSTDRTLMSSVRTALSLISFGFTIAQLFSRLRENNVIGVGQHSARNFGLALILLGIAVLAAGIGYHWNFERHLISRREALHEKGLMRSAAHYRMTPTFLSAVALMGIGVVAALSLVFRAMGAAP